MKRNLVSAGVLIFLAANAQAFECTDVTATLLDDATPSITISAGMSFMVKVISETARGPAMVTFKAADYSGPGPNFSADKTAPLPANTSQAFFVKTDPARFRPGYSHKYVGTVLVDGCSVPVSGEVNIEFDG